MKKSRKFISMPIVSLEEGLQIGSVRGLIVNSEKMEIAALVIDQRGWFREQKIIPYSKVRSVGADAITIDQSANVQRPVNLPEILKLIKEKVNPIGSRVISENGLVLGLVDEYFIDESSGKITGIEISGKFLESIFKGKAFLSTDHVRTMGLHAIVVNDGAQSELEKVDGGLQDTLNNIKEGTSVLLESTIQKTKKLSKNIKGKYDKKDQSLNINKPPTDETSDFSTKEDVSCQALEPDTTMDTISEIQITEEEVLPEVADIEPVQAETSENTDKETENIK